MHSYCVSRFSISIWRNCRFVLVSKRILSYNVHFKSSSRIEYVLVADSVVWTDEKFLEQLMYAFVNLCTSMSLRKTETVDIINAVLFKRTTQETPDDVLETWDISSKSGQQDR